MKVVEASPELVPALLERMGAERVAVLAHRAGGDPAQAIAANIARSPVTWTGLDADGVVVMGGAMPHGGDGYVWQFVIPDAVRTNKRGYLEMSRAMMVEGLRHFARLVTVIEASYPAALRHCERNGWTIGEPRVIGGVLAHVCERVR